jgi:sec-independent protein translocase protein TatA
MNVNIPELLIFLAIIIILFGPSRIADAGRSLGGAIKNVRRQLRDKHEGNEAGEQHQT